jgi:hypothetical protein
MAESKSPFRALAPAVWLTIFVSPAIIFYFIHRSVGPGIHEVAFSVLSHNGRALFTPHAVTLRIQ